MFKTEIMLQIGNNSPFPNPISCRLGGAFSGPKGKTAIATPKSNFNELKKLTFPNSLSMCL